MFKTPIGEFDGDRWEAFCQTCFTLKFESEGYQRMPARYNGDLGIEGFTTRTGKVFQCYCPDEETTPKDLYERQRDKVTNDLQKIEANKTQLEGYLNGTKIKEWILLTPRVDNKALIKHCRSKVTEYKAKNLDHLDPDFEVFVQEIDYLSEHFQVALGMINQKIAIIPDGQVSDVEITQWKGKTVDLVDNAVRKYESIVPESPNKNTRVNAMTDRAVKRFLNGNLVIATWKEKFPHRYENFEDIIGRFEDEVEDRCATHSGDNNELFKEIKRDLNTKLTSEFDDLSVNTVDTLCDLIVSRWILNCPLNFE